MARYKHKIRNAQYTITPVDYQFNGTQRSKTKGLRVRFNNHYWDSFVAQREGRWTDDERQYVERTLTEHPDFNRTYSLGMGGLYLDEAEHAAVEGTGGHDGSFDEPAQQDISAARCIYTIPLPNGAEQCKNPARENADYCTTHIKVMAKKKVEEARQKEPVGAD